MTKQEEKCEVCNEMGKLKICPICGRAICEKCWPRGGEMICPDCEFEDEENKEIEEEEEEEKLLEK